MSREYVLQPFRAPVDPQIDYAAELNEQQHAAVTALPGPALVIAGAGSGKTRTLIYRVAFLLEQGIPPDRILLLTFTNKAAREMMRRVAELLGNDLPSLWGGTFHSVAVRVLRRHAERIGFRADFTILDREDARDLVKACVAEAAIDVKATRFPKAEVLVDLFSMAANACRSVADLVRAEDYDHLHAVAEPIIQVGMLYAARKRKAQLMDFDDLLAHWLRLLREQEEVREHYQRRFQFVMVDEYQDTNTVQSQLIDLLAERHKNVMAVGDDAQSIYAWRGANYRNILEFPKRYPQARIYKIETNYRSTPEILALANAAIAPNIHQFAKELAPARASGDKPNLVVCQDGGDQACFVAQRLLELREEGGNLDRMAVLYRSHFHALELQLELTRRNIPFRITSGIRFFEQAHIKDVAAYLRFLANPEDELAFKRLAQLLPGIGGRGAEKLWAKFHGGLTAALSPAPVAPPRSPVSEEQGGDPGAPPADAAGQEDTRRAGGAGAAPVLLAPLLHACTSGVPRKALRAWTEFEITISQLEAEPVRGRPADLIQLILEAGYEDYLKASFTNHRARLEDVEQMAAFALQFKSLDEFLTQLSLLTNLEAEDSQPAAADTERVGLSTIHQAKGLEFDVVFLIMLCDGALPSARSLESDEGLEEERRLFYVAITRARDALYLSYPLVRLSPGYGGDAIQRPSRFLAEFSRELVEEWHLKPARYYG